MKYQIAVSQASGGYVGRAISDGKTAFTSRIVSDPTQASRLVSDFIKNNQQQAHHFQKAQQPMDIDRSIVLSNASPPAPTKCCGRV